MKIVVYQIAGIAGADLMSKRFELEEALSSLAPTASDDNLRYLINNVFLDEELVTATLAQEYTSARLRTVNLESKQDQPLPQNPYERTLFALHLSEGWLFVEKMRYSQPSLIHERAVQRIVECLDVCIQAVFSVKPEYRLLRLSDDREYFVSLFRENISTILEV